MTTTAFPEPGGPADVGTAPSPGGAWVGLWLLVHAGGSALAGASSWAAAELVRPAVDLVEAKARASGMEEGGLLALDDLLAANRQLGDLVVPVLRWNGWGTLGLAALLGAAAVGVIAGRRAAHRAAVGVLALKAAALAGGAWFVLARLVPRTEPVLETWHAAFRDLAASSGRTPLGAPLPDDGGGLVTLALVAAAFSALPLAVSLWASLSRTARSWCR